MLLFLAAIAVDNGDFLYKFYIPELISIWLFKQSLKYLTNQSILQGSMARAKAPCRIFFRERERANAIRPYKTVCSPCM